MTRIKYDADILKFISVFEMLTRAKVKDCLMDGKLTFIIEKGDMGLAIGKKGVNLQKVERALKRPVRIIEFDNDVKKFIKNYVFPINKFEISEEGKKIIIKGQDTKTKGFLIGRERANIKKLLGITQRFFDIEEIEVN